MGNMVVNGAMLMCSFGTGPCSLSVSGSTVMAGGSPAATAMCNTPANVSSFIMCTSPSNPAVASALGIPQPCSPVLTGSWSPGKPQVMIDGKPALDNSSTLMCVWGGCITVAFAGEVTINVN